MKAEPEHEEHQGPPRPPPRIPDGLPNPFYAGHKVRLAELRDEFSSAAGRPRGELHEEVEWSGLPLMLRFYLLTQAGLDDPDGALQRRWREYPDGDRVAVRAILRAWLRALDALDALTL